MMTDKAVAEADLITLVPGLELRFSPSAESCWWRTLRSTRSVVAPRGPCVSGSPRTVALLGRGNDASAGLRCLSVTWNPTVSKCSPCKLWSSSLQSVMLCCLIPSYLQLWSRCCLWEMLSGHLERSPLPPPGTPPWPSLEAAWWGRAAQSPLPEGRPGGVCPWGRRSVFGPQTEDWSHSPWRRTRSRTNASWKTNRSHFSMNLSSWALNTLKTICLDRYF